MTTSPPPQRVVPSPSAAPSRRACLRAAAAAVAGSVVGGLPGLAWAVDRTAENRQKILDYLMREYAKFSKSPDWVRRCLSVISYAKLPTAEAIGPLLDFVQRDANTVVQVLAWEGLRSRAGWLTAAQHAKWVAAAFPLARKGVFRGRLRTGLFDVLATATSTDRSYAGHVVLDAVVKTNTAVADDLVTLEAAGRLVRAWRLDSTVDALLAVVGQPNAGSRRSAMVLKAAGFPVPPAFTERGAAMPAAPAAPPPPPAKAGGGKPAAKAPATPLDELREFWQKERVEWKSAALRPAAPPTTAPSAAAEPWRSLKGDILPTIPADALLDPKDQHWMKEVELGKPELSNFDVAFAIDVSGSMGPALQWVQREVAGIMQAMTILAREPRLALTFFSNGSFTFKSHPLTGDIKQIADTLAKQQISGGGEELVLEALKDLVKTSPWPPSPKAAKVIVLVADEEIVPGQVPGCTQLMAELKPAGFRLFGLSPNRVPRTVKALAEAGGGQAFVMPLPGEAGRPPPPVTAAVEHPGAKLMTEIVSSVLSPAFRDRVAPLVTVTLLVNAEPFAEPG